MFYFQKDEVDTIYRWVEEVLTVGISPSSQSYIRIYEYDQMKTIESCSAK